MKRILWAAAFLPSLWGNQSYSNPQGSGDRRDLITTTASTNFISGSAGPQAGGSAWLDGSRTDHQNWFNGTSLTSAVFLEWDFYVPIIVDEATWYQSSATNQGTWQFQGSTDNSSWSNIGATFNYNTATFVVTTLHGNTTPFRFYRMLGVSGSTSSSPFQSEIEFRVNQPYPIAGGIDYVADARCFGNRTATITVSASAGLFDTNTGGPVSALVDGDPWVTTGQAFFVGTSNVSGATIEFDFGSGFAMNEARFYQDASHTNTLGVWQWQRSNDNSTWTNVGATFTLGGSPSDQTITVLHGNTTASRYWRLLGVSGANSASPFIMEFVFSVFTSTGGAAYTYIQ